MSGKGKFIYITGGEGDRIFIRDSSFPYNPDRDYAFALKLFSTDDLLKVKAQIATELENRMDYDEVVESNLVKLKSFIREEKGEVIAQLIVQTMNRLEQVSNDEKRAKARLEILKDEMKYRMEQDGESKKEFKGLLTASYETKTVYNVGEKGWDPVYAHIVADVVGNQFDERTLNLITNNVSNSSAMYSFSESLYKDVSNYKCKLETDVLTGVEGASERVEVVETVLSSLNQIKPNLTSIVEEVVERVVENLGEGLKNAEAFEILQKRLKSTYFDALTKEGETLPQGIETDLVREVKFKRNKK